MDNRGILRLCTFLEEQEIKVYEMNFSDNAIDDDGLYRLAQYITSEMAPVHALYMSANQISMQGVVRLLTMLSLHPMYPVEFDRGGKAAFLPLWLQLDNNMIENDHLQDFLDHQLSMLGCAICLGDRHCSRNWAAVKLNVSYYIGETILRNYYIYPF